MKEILQTDIQGLEFRGAPPGNGESRTAMLRELLVDAVPSMSVQTVHEQQVGSLHPPAQDIHQTILEYSL